MRALAILLLATAIATWTEASPQRRPALIGSGPRALVNLIDAAELMKQGQGDGWVMFDCVIRVDGTSGKVVQYRVSPDAQLLQREVSRKLKRSKFIPAVYNGRLTTAAISGTVFFVVRNGRPHLSIFLNQEMDELKRGADFIAPQMVEKGPSSFPGHASGLGLSSTVKIRHSVNAEGETTRVEVLSDNMPDEGFAHAAASTVRRSVFLPAYRNGKPVASVTTFEYRFYGRHYIE